MNDPPYINPSTDRIRCPINGFKDCVEERCIFWMRGRDARQMLSSWRYPGAEGLTEFDEEFTCQILVLSKIMSVLVVAFACMPQPIFGLEEERAPGQIVDLTARQMLKEISEKLDQLLKMPS